MSPLRAAALAQLLVLPVTLSAVAGEIAEISAPPFTITSPAALRHQADQIAASAPDLAIGVAGELALPPLLSGSIVVLGSTPKPGDPLFDAALGMPQWAAGQAFPSSMTIVLRLDRIGSYGQREIGSVLAHELTHLTIASALPRAGREIPAWFSEGIASSIAGEEEWRDLFVVWTSGLGSSAHPFSDLDRAFDRGEGSRALAYAGGLAAVGFLRRAHGKGFPARLLGRLRDGTSFDDAFQEATGITLDQAERAWRADLHRPQVWITWIGSAVTLWLAITVAVLIAYAIKRRRSRRTLQSWSREEGPDIWGEEPGDDSGDGPPLVPGGDDDTVH